MSDRAQALVGRWRALVEAFTGGDPEIQKGLNRMYSDMPQWPHERRAAFGIRPAGRHPHRSRKQDRLLLPEGLVRDEIGRG